MGFDLSAIQSCLYLISMNKVKTYYYILNIKSSKIDRKMLVEVGGGHDDSCAGGGGAGDEVDG